MAGPIDPVGNPMGALQQLAQERAQQQGAYRTQQQGAYADQMQQLRAAIEQENARDNDYAWGDAALGAASVEPRVGNFGQMLANTGAAVSRGRQGRAQQNIKNLGDVARMQSADLRALESNDILMRSLGGRGGAIGFEFRRNADGTTTVFSRGSGAPVATYGPKSMTDLNRMTETLAKKYIEAGDYKTMEEATAAAQAEALRILAQNAESVGSPNIPPTGTAAMSGGIPPAAPQGGISSVETPVGQAGPRPSLRMQGPDGKTSSTEGVDLPPEVQDEVARLIRRLEANPGNPDLHTNTVNRLNQIAQEYGAPFGLQKKDEVKREFQKEGAKTTGKALAEEAIDLQGAAAASSQLVSQLDLLKRLYQTPNMPEGEQAEKIQGIRSSLKSLGIDTGDATDAANLAGSIAGKMALLTRTADGKNLLPGAMSDYENKILRGLVPGLQATAEGRAALIDLMSAMANSRIRFAKEINNYMDPQTGVVSPEWNARKQRLMKEEMAKMATLNKQVAGRFNIGAQ